MVRAVEGEARVGDMLRDRLQAALGRRYVLGEEMSGGGASRVFAALETSLGRPVVLKVLAPEASTGEPLVQFRREASFAARLHHPHIVPVFTIGEDGGFVYYTMPLVNGEMLRTVLDHQGVARPEMVSRLIREIGSALAFAHDHGVIHRDVKPENIVLEHGTGRALLADFGIACIRDEMAGAAGATVGTPAYMSPEQVSGAPLDGRSDIYSLGLVGWEMLVGRRPYTGETPYEVMYKQRVEPLPSLSSLGVAAPEPLVAVLERATTKDLTLRFQSAADLVAALTADESSAPAPKFQALAAEQSLATAHASAHAADAVQHDSADEHVSTADAGIAGTPTLVMPRERPRRARVAAPPRFAWPDPDFDGERGTSARDAAVDSGGGWQSLRWAAAAIAAVGVTATIIGALAGRGTMTRVFGLATAEAASPAASATTAVADSEIPIRDVSSADMAVTTLTGIETDTTRVAPTPLASLPAADEKALVTASSLERDSSSALMLARVHHTLRVDRTRTAAATATLALEAYTEAVDPLRATPQRPLARSASPETPPVVDTERPVLQPAAADASGQDLATAVRVKPSPQAAPAPQDTTVLTPATSDAPAVGVRVGHGSATISDQPTCEPLFNGSHVCRIHDPRTGKMQYYYIR